MVLRESFELAGHGHGELPIPTVTRVGEIIATGGIRGVDRASGVLPDDLSRQVELMFHNLIAAVELAGGDAGSIVKVTVHIRDVAARSSINAAWLHHFPDAHSRPARHVIETPALAGRMLVQCEALALAVQEIGG
ncbi:RidA family protein [Sphingomonas sp. MG17]|uniref:RidA family protein n=1 Tax=Sphingomonas tagetis TaxID=2949092 RepID=A0A9X2HHI1_9SPHN|nr:RidA family protein [Sphingomonas tagetis]MCP3730037.1 RidA family protein [Sphingomonas tagetis]